MKIAETSLPGVLLITPAIYRDSRGAFHETFNQRRMAEAGLPAEWPQDNFSVSKKNVLRGIHYQVIQPQGKLVRVTQGAVLDVAVDLRRSSKTYGRHFALELSAENWRQLLVPIGFAHGFCTLEPDTEVLYKVTNVYSPAHDLGLAFDDPALGIDWVFDPAKAKLSDRDRRHPRLAELPALFD